MIEPLCPALTFEQCIDHLSDALRVDMRPASHDQRLLLVHYFCALVIGGRLPAGAHDGMGNTALHYCARVGWAAGVSSLISSGVYRAVGSGDDDSNACAGMGEAAAVLQTNTSGCSALHCACVATCLRTLNLLMHCLADLQYDEFAADGGSGKGVDRIVDSERRTLLHYAGA
jgi:ankyrin repeat protein